MKYAKKKFAVGARNLFFQGCTPPSQIPKDSQKIVKLKDVFKNDLIDLLEADSKTQLEEALNSGQQEAMEQFRDSFLQKFVVGRHQANKFLFASILNKKLGGRPKEVWEIRNVD
jgi:hypothetical protein